LKTITTSMQILGAALVVYGVSLLSVPIAIVLGGSFTILFGIALERENK
jgi:hypothetical protein